MKFNVTFIQSYSCEVEADNEDDAFNKAYDDFHDYMSRPIAHTDYDDYMIEAVDESDK